MMKLSNLLMDTDIVAQKALELWEYDKGTVKFWRGSSNIVYYFEFRGKGYFLRLSYEEENSDSQILAELDFLFYLRENNYPCNEPIESKGGKYLETIQTPQGIYYAVVFKEVVENPLNIHTMLMKDYEEWGRALAQLHKLSSVYTTKIEIRHSWKDKLVFIGDVLSDFPEEKSALRELEKVYSYLSSLETNKDNYGLIHYDFAPDNVFKDEKSNVLNVIDFDDSMYHWYMMDIVSVIEGIEGVKENDYKINIQSFLEGYGSIKELKVDWIKEITKFKRFSELYTFARLQRSLKDSYFETEPDWVDLVRSKLESKCNIIRERFDLES